MKWIMRKKIPILGANINQFVGCFNEYGGKLASKNWLWTCLRRFTVSFISLFYVDIFFLHEIHSKHLQYWDFYFRWYATLMIPVCRCLSMLLFSSNFFFPENNAHFDIIHFISDGRSRAGVYCAANACIEQVIQHGEVDIFQAVKTVRRHRPQLIENMVKQLTFLILLQFRGVWFLFGVRCFKLLDWNSMSR